MQRNGHSGDTSFRDRKGGSSRLIDAKHFIVCKWILSAFFLTSLIVQPVFGGNSRNMNDVVKNPIDRRSQANKSDIDIFYNNTDGAVDAENESEYVGECATCLKEHRVKTREVPEDRRRKRKVRSNERRKGRASSAESTAGIGRLDDGLKVGCNSCMREKMRSISLEAIKGNILSKLGMSQPPNLKGRPLPKIADHRLAALLSRRHNGPNGVYWVLHEDELEDMQGDGPYDRETSDKANGKSSDFSNKNNTLGFDYKLSDYNHNDTSHFQDAGGYVVEDDEYYVRTEKIFAFSEPESTLYLESKVKHSQNVQHFQFSDKIRNSKVKKAVLWVYIRGRDSVNVVGDNITITIYRILHVGESVNGSRDSPIITSILAGLNQSVPDGIGGWITLDYIQIRNLVAEWFRYPQHNLGIIITADDANRNNLAVTSQNGNGTAFVPFLEIHVTDSNKNRKKRSFGLNCNDSSNETRCCRHPLTVNFEEFGWDWIIAPRRYEANSCSGECPFAFMTKHPHTHVMQLLKAQGIGQCCSPRKVSGIFMIYFDQHLNIRQGVVPGMVVDSCGCD